LVSAIRRGESRSLVLRGEAGIGMAAPVLAVGNGALAFWSAVREVLPETREQRCWWHKIGNVLNSLPKSAQPGAKKALAEIWNAEDKDHAQAEANVFAADYGTKWPKAAAKITDDLDVLMAFHDYPAEHWIHLCTTNPSSPPSPPSGFARESPRAPAPAPGLGIRVSAAADKGHDRHLTRPA
jgi:putative transposase